MSCNEQLQRGRYLKTGNWCCLTFANPDLRNFGERNIGDLVTFRSTSNNNYVDTGGVENWK